MHVTNVLYISVLNCMKGLQRLISYENGKKSFKLFCLRCNQFATNSYEILTVAMAPPEGEEEHSQAYYVIKVMDWLKTSILP